MVHNIGENNSIFNQFISQIRDINQQNDPLRFRRNIERVGEIFAYEISKTFEYNNVDIQTPLATSTESIPTQQPVLATILRAGLPLHQGLLNYFDRSENCFISAYRKHTDEDEFHIEFEYIASPDLTDKVVIMSDPMLATGASMEVGFKALFEKGTPKHVHLVSVIASQEGIDYVMNNLPKDKFTLWVGAIDPILNEKSYIVPGLGDAGDLAYGTKVDSK